MQVNEEVGVPVQQLLLLSAMYLGGTICFLWWARSDSNPLFGVLVTAAVLTATGWFSLMLTHRERINEGFFERPESGSAPESQAGKDTAKAANDDWQEDVQPSVKLQQEELEQLSHVIATQEDQLHTHQRQSQQPDRHQKNG